MIAVRDDPSHVASQVYTWHDLQEAGQGKAMPVTQRWWLFEKNLSRPRSQERRPHPVTPRHSFGDYPLAHGGSNQALVLLREQCSSEIFVIAWVRLLKETLRWAELCRKNDREGYDVFKKDRQRSRNATVRESRWGILGAWNTRASGRKSMEFELRHTDGRLGLLSILSHLAWDRE